MWVVDTVRIKGEVWNCETIELDIMRFNDTVSFYLCNTDDGSERYVYHRQLSEMRNSLLGLYTSSQGVGLAKPKAVCIVKYQFYKLLVDNFIDMREELTQGYYLDILIEAAYHRLSWSWGSDKRLVIFNSSNTGILCSLSCKDSSKFERDWLKYVFLEQSA